MRTPLIRTVAAVATLAVLGGCGGAAGTGGSAEGSGPGGTVTVFAAASLTESFTRIGRDFEAVNPGTTVVFNFAGSSALAAQVTQGAPADVFAAADERTMAKLSDAGDTDGAPAVFARNQLVIAVPKGNPERVGGLADLARTDLKVALCAEQVPCGAAARAALDVAAVGLTPVTLEQDVKGALSKVRLGEVDAALVYRTDARAAAADVTAVEFPESAAVVNDYPIATLRDAPNPGGARAFVAYVRSDPGREVLTDAGFRAP